MRINITDNFAFNKSSRKITREGYLKATAALTRVGVQSYQLSDFTGNAEDANTIAKVLRPPKTVFSEDTIESAKLKPVTMYHPSEMVDSENHRNYAVGSIGENVYKLDADRLGATILITNKDVVKEINDGKVREVSMGYSADVKEESGNYNGDSYTHVFDGAMTINHCAIVSKGRCGGEVSILDSKNSTQPKDNKTMTKEDILKFITDDEAFKNTLKDCLKSIQEKEAAKSLTDDIAKKTAIKDEVNKESQEDKPAVNSEVAPKTKPIQDADIAKQVKFRANLIDKARHFIKDNEDLTVLDNRQILEKTLTDVKDIKDKSDDYLMGLMDAVITDHQKAKQEHKTLGDATVSSMGTIKQYNGLEIQAL